MTTRTDAVTRGLPWGEKVEMFGGRWLCWLTTHEWGGKRLTPDGSGCRDLGEVDGV